MTLVLVLTPQRKAVAVLALSGICMSVLYVWGETFSAQLDCSTLVLHFLGLVPLPQVCVLPSLPPPVPALAILVGTWVPPSSPWTEPCMGRRPWLEVSQVPGGLAAVLLGSWWLSPWTPPSLKTQNSDINPQLCPDPPVALGGTRSARAPGLPGLAHSPSPRKMMRFLADV